MMLLEMSICGIDEGVRKKELLRICVKENET